MERPRATDPVGWEGVVGNQTNAAILLAKIFYNFGGAVCRAAVYHNNFADFWALLRESLQARGNAIRFVESGDNNANAIGLLGCSRLRQNRRLSAGSFG